MPPRPVRPKDAASLILVRRRGGAYEVLMGRRAGGHAFMPHFYVFPGGRVDRADAAVAAAGALPEQAMKRLSRSCPPKLGRALAVAAVRETAEETGLLLARPAPGSGVAAPPWPRFAEQHLLPALDVLDYVGRAITPSYEPIRFHNRFFLADARHLRGRIAGSGELVDLGWRSIERSLALGLADVTEFMLHQALHLFTSPRADAAPAPLFRYHYGKVSVRYD